MVTLINPSQKWDLKAGVLALSEKLVSRSLDIRPLIGSPFFASGGVLFAGPDGLISQDNANLFWDNVNKRLGIGTDAPSERLHVIGNVRIDDAYKLTWSDVNLYRAGANLLKTDSNLAIGTLTTGSILFAGSNGVISQDNTNLFWDNVNKRLGIGTNAPLIALHVAGRVAIGDSITYARLTSAVGPRALSIIDANAVVRIWRYTNISVHPAIEFIWGINDDVPSPENCWWDIHLHDTDSLRFRRRTGGVDQNFLVISKDGMDARSNVYVNRVGDASSTNTLRNSFNLVFRAAYWTGSASAIRDAAIFHRMLSTAPTSEIAFQIAGVDLAMLRDDMADGETALLIRRNVGGTYSVVRVSMGPPDSGGTGYRVLRVPN